MNRRIHFAPLVKTVRVPALRRRAALAAAALLALGLTACGHKESHPTFADNEGVYVDAGPLTYQVQISRELNPLNVEDKEYLAGVTAPATRPSEMWFAVFVWAKNNTDASHTTAGTDSFDIVDTELHHYYPVAINPSDNPYAWNPQTLKPLNTYPVPDSTAYFGPTQGAELLFKLPISGETAVFANRPLALEIHVPGQEKASRISLDL
jgi:hypothetical protein